MRRGKRNDRAALDESMSRRMHGNLIENAGQNSPLQQLEPRLWNLQQTYAARAFRQDPVMVMLQFRIAKFIAELFQIGEPLQFVDAQTQPIRQASGGFNHRQIPTLRRLPPVAYAGARRSIRRWTFHRDNARGLAKGLDRQAGIAPRRDDEGAFFRQTPRYSAGPGPGANARIAPAFAPPVFELRRASGRRPAGSGRER